MNKMPLACANLRFILLDGDLIVLRFGLAATAVGSILWTGIMLWYGMTVAEIEDSRRLMYDVAPLWAWTLISAVYGVAVLTLVALKIDNKFVLGRSLNILISAIGALLWTMNVDLLLASRIDQGVLTLMTAQWSTAAAAWWVFIRDCYGR